MTDRPAAAVKPLILSPTPTFSHLQDVLEELAISFGFIVRVLYSTIILQSPYFLESGQGRIFLEQLLEFDIFPRCKMVQHRSTKNVNICGFILLWGTGLCNIRRAWVNFGYTLQLEKLTRLIHPISTVLFTHSANLHHLIEALTDHNCPKFFYYLWPVILPSGPGLRRFGLDLQPKSRRRAPGGWRRNPHPLPQLQPRQGES